MILLRKHATFPPLILSALLTYIQAHHDSIDNPRYQPRPRPQPRRCRLPAAFAVASAVASLLPSLSPPLSPRCHLRCHLPITFAVAIGSPGSPPGYIHIGIRCGGFFFGIFPKGEKCCQFLAACYVHIVLMKLFTTPRSQSLPMLLLLLPPSPSQPSLPPPLPLLLLQPLM